MENEKLPVIDWVFPPASMERVSLWDCLHDAKLASVHVDSAESSLQLEFDVWHIRRFHGLDEDLRFRLQFSGVKSLRVIANGPSFDTSFTIGEFKDRIDAEGGLTDTFEADLLRGPDSVALRLFLHVNDEFYPELIVRAKSLTVSMSSGESLSVDHFLRLGEAYWKDFAERSSQKRD
jgi:hypothetical protein